MLYIERNEDGAIVAIHQAPSAKAKEQKSLMDEEVIKFLGSEDKLDSWIKLLSLSDISIIRVLEDLIDLLVSLPVILLVLFGLLIGVGVYFLIIAENPFLTVAGTIAMIGLFFLLIFLGVVLAIGLMLIRDFFWRACALEQVGVGEALRLGWSMVKRNWKSVGLMWLVMIAIRIGWTIALVIALVLSIPLFILTGLAGLLVGGLPAVLVGGLSSLFLSGPLPWIVGALFGLPFFLVVASLPLLFLRGLGLVYQSTVWTLTYRELRAMQGLATGTSEPLLNAQLPVGGDNDPRQ